MTNNVHSIIGVKVFAILGLVIFLGGSQAQSVSVTATYSLTKINGEEIPAVSWIKEGDGKRCEYLTFGGALLLNSEGRSGAFAMERVNCTDKDGFKTSTLGDFTMFTAQYEISGNQITFNYDDMISHDNGTLQGDLLILEVVGVYEYEGQTTVYTFNKF